MADCRDLESLFASYVDGESAPPDCAEIEAHLRACPECRDRIACEREIHDALARCREKLRACAPPDLRTRCDAGRHAAVRSVSTTAPPPQRAIGRRGTLVSLSMAATLLLAVAGVFLYGLQGGSEALAAQLA